MPRNILSTFLLIGMIEGVELKKLIKEDDKRQVQEHLDHLCITDH